MNYESQKKKILALDSDTDWWNLMPRNERQIEASHGSNVYVFKTLIVPAEVVLRLSFNLTIDTWPKKTKQRQFQPNKEINHSPKNIFCCFQFAARFIQAHVAHIPVLFSGRFAFYV